MKPLCAALKAALTRLLELLMTLLLIAIFSISLPLVFACLLLLMLVGCGGGGGQSGPAPIVQSVPAAPRTDLLFGYFADSDTSLEQTKDHINLNFVTCFGQSDPVLLPNCAAERITRAHAAGVTKSVLAIDGLVYAGANEHPALKDNLRTLFNGLRNANVLNDVIALYPKDEPELYGISDATANSVNAHIREVMAEFNWSAKLAVIYGGQSRDKGSPGMASFDWIGFDDYGIGIGVFNHYQGKRAEQKWILVPGGADPWRNDPQPFLDRANADPEVVAIIAFIWIEGASGTGAGIGSNGMAAAYKAVGLKVSHS